MAARCISLMMCKGGVGKTTVAYFLATRMASLGARVLVIDSDPQGNLTAAFRPDRFGFSITDRTPVLVDVLTQKCRLTESLLRLTPQLHILPSTAINSLLERKLLASQKLPVTLLHSCLRAVDTAYDFILVDSAPALNVVNAAIIYASHQIILPVQLDEFSRLGLRQTISEIHDLEREFDFTTKINILINSFNPREKLSFLYLGHIAQEYRELMLKTTIRQSTAVKMAISLQRDVFARASTWPKEDFAELARELWPASPQLQSNTLGVQHARD